MEGLLFTYPVECTVGLFIFIVNLKQIITIV